MNIIQSQRTNLLVTLIAFVVLSLIAFSYYSSIRMLDYYAPQVRAIENIRLQATTAHLWVEEIIGGDDEHNMDEVSWILDEADWYAQAILEGGIEVDITYLPIRDPVLRQKVEVLRNKLGALREITEERYETDQPSGPGTTYESYYDLYFYELLDIAEDVGDYTYKLIRAETIIYRTVEVTLAVIVFFLFILAGFLLHRNQFLHRKHANQLEQEVSERKHAEITLKRSEELLSKIYSTTPDAVMISRMTDGMIMYVNPAFTKMFAYPTVEALGKTVTGLNLWQDLDKRIVLFRELDAAGAVNEFESEFLTAGKEVLPVSIAASMVDIEDEMCMVSVIRDNTDSKRSYQIQSALAEIMQISLQPGSMEEMLSRALDIMLSLPTFSVQKKGAIFLARDNEETVELLVHSGLPEQLQHSCKLVPFGKCLCGRAAEDRKIIFSDEVDGHHEISYAGMETHGHYCVPIMTGNRLLGVFNAYVEAGASRKKKDEEILKVAVNALAHAIGSKQSAGALHESEELLSKVMEHTADAIFVHNFDGMIIKTNKVASEFTGYSREELVGMYVSEIDYIYTDESARELMEQITVSGSIIFESIHQRKDGSTYPVEISTGSTHHGDEILFLTVVRDITQRRQAEEEIRHMANHDMLTGLPNRNLFMDRLEQALARSRRNNLMTAVMFLDLDNFKPINDTVGHASGDVVLKQIGEKLSSCMRETDTVARFGGDEFIILMSDIKDTEGSTQMAEKINRLLSEPIYLGDMEYILGVSIGIALYPTHAETSDALILKADETMYKVKRKEKNGFLYATSTA